MKRIYEVKPKSKKKAEKIQELAWLMSELNVDHAIRLQLDNLILTYGLRRVKLILEETKLGKVG